jgi:tetratricopeptide (TPR) repeat protein
MAINIRKKDEDAPQNDGDGEDQPVPNEAAAADADPFIRNSADAVTWFADNRNTVFGGLAVAALVGIAAYIGYNQYRSGMVEASSSWGEAIAQFERPVEGSEYVSSIRDTDFNLPDDAVHADLETKWTEVNNRAKSTLETYGKSRIADDAHLTRAAAEYRLGNYKTAVEHYQTYLDGKPSDQMVSVVYYGAGLAHGAAGNLEKAVSMFDKLAEANADYEVLALYQKGIVHEEAGNLKKAKDAYDKALDSASSSPYHTNINRRRTLISVRD